MSKGQRISGSSSLKVPFYFATKPVEEILRVVRISKECERIMTNEGEVSHGVVDMLTDGRRNNKPLGSNYERDLGLTVSLFS